MKNLSENQIEQVKNLKPFTSTNFHGNKKMVGSLSVDVFKKIVFKKRHRFDRNVVLKNGSVVYRFDFKTVSTGKIESLKKLLSWSLSCKGTNYFKILIEGNTGIYYAHPGYGHTDYNKSRVFEKNAENLKLMQIFNSILNK